VVQSAAPPALDNLLPDVQQRATLLARGACMPLR